MKDNGGEEIKSIQEMKQKWEGEVVERKAEAYEALAKAQDEMDNPKCDKRVKVDLKKGGHFVYFYAPLTSVLKSVRPPLNKHGFTLSSEPVVHRPHKFSVREWTNKHGTKIQDIRAVIAVHNVLRYKNGYEIRFKPFKLPIPKSIKGIVQETGGTITTAKRLSLCAHFSIRGEKPGEDEPPHEADTAPTEPGNKKQKRTKDKNKNKTKDKTKLGAVPDEFKPNGKIKGKLKILDENNRFKYGKFKGKEVPDVIHHRKLMKALLLSRKKTKQISSEDLDYIKECAQYYVGMCEDYDSEPGEVTVDELNQMHEEREAKETEKEDVEEKDSEEEEGEEDVFEKAKDSKDLDDMGEAGEFAKGVSPKTAREEAEEAEEAEEEEEKADSSEETTQSVDEEAFDYSADDLGVRELKDFIGRGVSDKILLFWKNQELSKDKDEQRSSFIGAIEKEGV